jgi:hypothetical protein
MRPVALARFQSDERTEHAKALGEFTMQLIPSRLECIVLWLNVQNRSARKDSSMRGETRGKNS